jgi:hypothetical protein
MSSRHRRTSIKGQWAGITIEMLESPAYRALTLSALRILARLQIELANHGGKDNGRLPCTYENFQQYGIDKHSIAPALSLLQALGFIQITEVGRAGNAEWRRPSRYRLTFRGPSGGYDGTDEWRGIDEDQAMLIVQAVRQQSRKKRKSGGGFSPFTVENPHRKSKTLGGETPTTVHGGDSHTTIDIPTRVGAA